MRLLPHIIALLTFCLPLTASADEQKPATEQNFSSPHDVFEHMKSLVGEYKEDAAPAEAATVRYELLSRGSALTETWHMASGKKELTVFHMDNGVLVATHYCAANIQTTMAMAFPRDGDFFDFERRSISNLKTPEAAHNSGFSYQFFDDGRIARKERWTNDGEISHSSLTLVRQ